MAEKSKNCRRVVLITLDGVGIGALPDAQAYGDLGAHTLRHVAESFRDFCLPNLQRLGLGNIDSVPGIPQHLEPQACYGKMSEVSCGKDTTTGHWELCGLQILRPFQTYPQGFPEEIIDTLCRRIGQSVLGNYAASGTDIIRDLGDQHRRTGLPIVYTSSDSVFQIAAHEEVIPIERLYEICRIAREILNDYYVARVIARPFTGASTETYKRTSRRKDFSIPPTGRTILDAIVQSTLEVYGVGKISDIFAAQGVSRSVKTESDRDGMNKIIEALETATGGLVFANLVDFDMHFGHRCDAIGFALNLQMFDAFIPDLLSRLGNNDLLLITADHGCDPTTPGTDHTREYVPVLMWNRNFMTGVDLGVRESFADVAATIGEWLEVASPSGTSLLRNIEFRPE